MTTKTFFDLLRIALGMTSVACGASIPGIAAVREEAAPDRVKVTRGVSSSSAAMPQVEHEDASVMIEAPREDQSSAISDVSQPSLSARNSSSPRSYRVKYIAGRTVYIDGGSNSGLRIGMHLEVHHVPSVIKEGDDAKNIPGSLLRVIGVATTSAITQVDAGDSVVKQGDVATLEKADAVTAARNAANPVDKNPIIQRNEEEETPQSASETAATTLPTSSGANAMRSTAQGKFDTSPRMAGRIGLDASGISSTGSTPGQSLQTGMSFQSDMTHILGTHWSLQGYWRGRINRYSQLQAAPADEVLNKTYTMQLYYENPNSKWVAGVGRLYLPWAVSLDTIDGGYVGHKFFGKMTTGVFAGSTPDLNSWHYRPDQRIGGSFVNFEGGDYERFHYSSTSGIALSSIKWKLDRPFAFFENEASYKGKVSIYHSLIADSPRGISTPGWKPGAGISHSYFTAHYQPKRMISFDLYHNYFRDAPTAQTRVVGAGSVDNLLFQGFSGGVHFRPSRYVTLYTTLGMSSKTGDECRSLNQMYGATWNEILHTGLRADFHYTKFESSFGDGNYRFLSISRQITNRMFWNVALGDQKLITDYSQNYSSKFMANSVDLNIGRHSYLQSGYTYVNGASMNYKQWYMSLGFRLDKGRDNPEYIQTLNPTH